MRYETVQTSPLFWPIFVLGASPVLVATAVPMPWEPAVLLVCCGLVTLSVAVVFSRLTIRDAGDHLLVHFGLFPVWPLRIKYREIQKVEPDRSTLFDGWGLHYTRHGWLFNVWGFDCVRITTAKRSVRVGTREPEELVDFLETARCNGL